MTKAFFNSMTGRIFLLLVGGTILTGALVMALAGYERRDLAMQIRAHHATERVGQIILMLDAMPPALRQNIVSIAGKYGVLVKLTGITPLIGKAPDTGFVSALKRELGETRVITAFQRQDLECPVKFDEQEAVSPGPHHCETVYATLKDGTPVQLDVAHHDRPPHSRTSFY